MNNKVSAAEGRLGILLPGLGAVATTLCLQEKVVMIPCENTSKPVNFN